jgi:hypothetical protein
MSFDELLHLLSLSNYALHITSSLIWKPDVVVGSQVIMMGIKKDGSRLDLTGKAAHQEQQER